jgi:hypothetical protein
VQWDARDAIYLNKNRKWVTKNIYRKKQGKVKNETMGKP